MASIYGTMLGFSLATVAIVLGLVEHPRMKLVRDGPHYDTLWDTFKSAIRVLGLATIVAVIGLIWDKENSSNRFILYFNVFFLVLSFARISRCIWILDKVIKINTGKTK